MTKASAEKLGAREQVDRNVLGKVHLRGRDPRKEFYMGMSVGNLDGSVDEPCGVEFMVDTEKDALQNAETVNESYPTLEVWIYKCTPIAKVWRGPTKVTRFK